MFASKGRFAIDSVSQTAGLGYHEPAQSLDQRIHSHRDYSNFDLHRWLHDRFRLSSGERILDVGCGNGNFTNLFHQAVGAEGTIIGTDKNPDLIAQAKERHAPLLSDRVQFHVVDFDDGLNLARVLHTPAPQFDWIFAIYTLYYANHGEALMEELASYLSPEGRLVIIGPGPENGRDIEAINLRVTGREPRPEYLFRQERIATEFFPLAQRLFSQKAIERQIIDNTMTFPTASEFADYYHSSLLWRESIEGASPAAVEEMRAASLDAAGSGPVVIRKQVYCIVAQK